MKDLIAKLEAATEGSRELDSAIAWEAGADFIGCTGQRWRDHYPYILARGNLYRAANNYGIPHYTTSLDAAMTLVSEGKCAQMGEGKLLGRHEAAAAVGDYFSHRDDWTAEAATLPLALCIAALKARAIDMGGE